jgi:ABC-type hemin transport system substrate-binding protein
LRILKTSKCLTVTASAKERPDLVVVAQEGDKKLSAAVLKNEPEISVAAKFEKLVAQLANSKTAVHVRPAESIRQIAKSQKAFHPFALRQFAQPGDDCGVDRKKLTQASS